MTISQKYNKIVTPIALKRNGINAESFEELTPENWEYLIELGNGDENFTKMAVHGFFDQVGTDYLDADY